MTFSVLLSFMLYSFVTSVTPGPNNIMLLSSGINFGFKKSIPHILGIAVGFGLMVALVGLGIGSILTSSQLVYEIVKVIGIVYLLYLAYQIFITDSIHVDTQPERHKALSFSKVALFQWVNPKAWIMTMGAVTTYTASSSGIGIFLFIGFVYGVISIPSVGIWAFIGDKLQKFITDQKKVKLFNVVMALLLVASVISPLYETIKFFFHI